MRMMMTAAQVVPVLWTDYRGGLYGQRNLSGSVEKGKKKNNHVSTHCDAVAEPRGYLAMVRTYCPLPLL
jgi:hypothetical protein